MRQLVDVQIFPFLLSYLVARQVDCWRWGTSPLGHRATRYRKFEMNMSPIAAGTR